MAPSVSLACPAESKGGQRDTATSALSVHQPWVPSLAQEKGLGQMSRVLGKTNCSNNSSEAAGQPALLRAHSTPVFYPNMEPLIFAKGNLCLLMNK